jgi:GTP-binding protein Era
MKSGFVNILGRPNAGKSTLLNALMGEKLAIVSSKVQTTRHRIKGILNGPDYQVIISDTPGIIEPRYKLHERMMKAVSESLADADLVLLTLAVNDNWEENDRIFASLRLKAPAWVVLNKSDLGKGKEISDAESFFSRRAYCQRMVKVSSLTKRGIPELLKEIVDLMPEGEPFYEGDDMTDLPVKFFAGEMVRKKIFDLYQEEIPYHATVLVQEFQDKHTLIKIRADIILQRETQKAILLGEGGKMIKKLGTEARIDMEEFLGKKVFLELFVKVRPHWRDNDRFLKEYGY